MLLAAVAVAFLALEPVVRVEGESVCPTAGEVQAELARLSGQLLGIEARRDAGTDVAIVRAAAGLLHVELHRSDGTLVGEKDLVPGSRCAELAQAIAVVITAWESQLRFDVAPQPPPPVSTSNSVSEPMRRDGPMPAVVLPPMAPAPAPGPGTQTSWGLELGLGASLVWPTPRLGGELFLAVGRSGLPWLGHLVVNASTWHSAALGGGTGKWMRATVGLGGGRAWRGARLTAQVETHLLGAATLASADGFGVGWTVRRQTTLEPGVSAGLRLLGPRRSRLGGWLAAETAVWFRRRSLNATDQAGGVVDHVDLPGFELWLSVGGILTGLH